MLNERPYLYVVEVAFINHSGYNRLTAIPRYLKLRILLMNILCQDVHSYRIIVASHECKACDVGPVLLDECVDGPCIERQAYIFP